jgi:hypothetical protein
MSGLMSLGFPARVVFLNALSQERLRYANLLNALGR